MDQIPSKWGEWDEGTMYSTYQPGSNSLQNEGVGVGGGRHCVASVMEDTV